MTEPLLPGAVPRQCSCCHRPVPTGRVYGPGLGEKCARRRGVIPPRQPRVPRLRVVVQDGPDLFDALDDDPDTSQVTGDEASCTTSRASVSEGAAVVTSEVEASTEPASGNPWARSARQAADALYRDLAPSIEAFLRDTGFALTEWQKQILAGIPRVQLIQPRRQSFSAQMETLVRSFGFLPLVTRRQAAILTQHGLSEGVHFLRYPDAPKPDEPPTDPMLAAIEAKKHRNTGPPRDRLDGRRQRRR